METPVLLDAQAVARQTARLLLEVKAVNFRADPPFTLTSGRKSPVYVDCRKLISYPRLRRALMGFATAMLMRDAGAEAFDSVAGGETAGIPYAAWIAEALGLPMTYVRKKPKGFGRNARIEGDLREGERVLLVEDLATDGGSKIGFVEALREAGATCDHVFVVFHYGIFPRGMAELEAMGVKLHALATWHDVLAEAHAEGHFDEPTLCAVQSFLQDPEAWQAAHAED